MRRLLLAALIAVGLCAPAQAAFQLTDIACETTTTAGTGTIDLGGALTGGWLGFAAAGISSGSTVPYEITDGTQLETGIGTFTTGTPNTLARTSVKWSTDGAATALTLSGGTATVCIGPIASVWNGGFLTPYYAAIELGDASDTTIARSAAGAATIEGKAIKSAGSETIFIPAGAMYYNSGAGAQCANYDTSGFEYRYCPFDPTTGEFAAFEFRFPKNWNEGTITAQFYWSHPATATNFGVVWALTCGATSDNEALNATVGYQQIADTGGTTGNNYITGATPAITVSGTPVAGDLIDCVVKRIPTDASDTMAVDAYLHGIFISYTSDAANDN